MLALAFSALLLSDPQTVVVAAEAPAVVTQTSLIRIREALSKPAGLRVTVPEPTFRVEVRAHPPRTSRISRRERRPCSTPPAGPA